MKSNDDDSSWTSITISGDVSKQVGEFCDTYDISGKGEGVKRALELIQASGIPLTQDDSTDITEALNLDEDDIDSVKGFVLPASKGGLRLLGTEGQESVLITDIADSGGPIQPLLSSRITDGVVYCPACGSSVLEYTLSELLPEIETGMFSDLNLHCETCGSDRPHYTLFTAKSGIDPNPQVIEKASKSYLAYVLIMDRITPMQFNDRVMDCKRLAEDAGWEWLPDPNVWIGFKTGSAGPLTTEQYANFIRDYIRMLAEDDSDVQLMEVSVSPPTETDRHFTAEWEIQLETQGKPPDGVVEEVESLAASWDSVSVDVREVDPETFAADTVVVTLNGLQSLAEIDENE